MTTELNFYDSREECPNCGSSEIECKTGMGSAMDDKARKVQIESWYCIACRHSFEALSPWEEDWDEVLP